MASRVIIFTFLVLALTACEQDEAVSHSPVQKREPIQDSDPASLQQAAAHHTEAPLTNPQLTIENKRYLFDVTQNTKEELKELLARIDEIMEASPEMFDELEIVMVLHGPDINLFTENNYTMNKELVDLAEKLDAFKVVDMKVCETTMDSLGVNNTELPSFIETVPYALDTINDLREQGYVNL